MKHLSLRQLMKRSNLGRPYTLSNSVVIMDGHFLTEMYRTNDFPFILGGEYDRFASYLKSLLSHYIECNITCYVIFGGGNKTAIEKRLEIHQKIIDRTDAVGPDNKNITFCEPLFIKDVSKGILDELGIKHFTCMYNFLETLFSLAKKLKNPIVSTHFEYSLFGVSVIPPHSVKFDRCTKKITGTIYHADLCKRWHSLSDDVLSIFLTITDENIDFYYNLFDIFQAKPERYVFAVFHWIKRQSKDCAIGFLTKYLTSENKKVLLDSIEEYRTLFFKSRYNLGTEFFCAPTKLEARVATDDFLFEKCVGMGRIAPVYSNLKMLGIFSGTWLVTDKNQKDAMLPALDIALYALALLTNSQHVKVTFICRDHNVSDVKEIERVINIIADNRNRDVPLKSILKSTTNHFMNFVTDQLPGFDLKLLENLPKECWILLISILYYSVKSNKPFIKEAYCIILSYVLLGPVSTKVGIIKKSNFSITHAVPNDQIHGCVGELYSNFLTHQECAQAANGVIELFYLPEGYLQDIFDFEILHTFAEFQHCLQHMNFLNKLCGENIKCTVYHRAINCTFIYNLFILLKDKDSPDTEIENLLNSSEVFKFFKKVLSTYFKCVAAIITK